MNKLLIFCGIAATLVFSDCTKKFDSINTDPTRPSAAQFDPNLLLPSVETGYTGAIAGYGGAILYQSMWVQIFANPEYPGYYTNGDKYVNGGITILTLPARGTILLVMQAGHMKLSTLRKTNQS